MLGILKRKNPVLVTGMTAEHFRQCADIHSQSFSRGWSDGALHEMLSANGVSGTVACRKSGSGEVVDAFLVYRTAAQECEIITIATAEGQRKKGAARALLTEMIRLCLTDRLEHVFLEVDESNLPAIRLYHSLGFREVGKRKAYYPPDETGKNENENKRGDLAKIPPSAHDAIIMRLDLQD